VRAEDDDVHSARRAAGRSSRRIFLLTVHALTPCVVAASTWHLRGTPFFRFVAITIIVE